MEKKNNKKIFIIVGVVVIVAIIGVGILVYSNYTKQKEEQEKLQKEEQAELQKLEKSENYFYEYLQTTIDDIERDANSTYSLCITVADQLKKYGEAKTFYSAYNSSYARNIFADIQARMNTLDSIKPKSNKYNTEHQKVIELYYEYKDIYNIGITIPTSNYEDYAYTLAKEKAEYNAKLKEIRQLMPKVVEKQKY